MYLLVVYLAHAVIGAFTAFSPTAPTHIYKQRFAPSVPTKTKTCGYSINTVINTCFCTAGTRIVVLKLIASGSLYITKPHLQVPITNTMASVFLVIEEHYYQNDISTSLGFKKASHSDICLAHEYFIKRITRILVS